MKEVSIEVFRGLAIILLSIIGYFLISPYIDYGGLPLLIALFSGVLIILASKDIKRNELMIFRITLISGGALFIIGNLYIVPNLNMLILTEKIIYELTLGLLLSSIGVIVIFSSMPIIIYRNLKDYLKQSKNKSRTK
ncbi:MAG: hypothetical protein EU548_09285 [Promethearchaeota archaeon]|nr:MAG: hypothetical protein EU548_09285 [Candidatus Lokiarchaeota archaeon]